MSWNIDDTVYFLDETCENGEFPEICKGKVEEIHRDKIRVKVPPKYSDYSDTEGNLLFVRKEYCFKSLKALCNKLKEHINNETQRLDGCIYNI